MTQKPNILVVGDVMLDRYIHGVVERISPEAPIPILRQTHIEDRAGGAANVACNLAGLGAEVWLVSASGLDDESERLDALLEAFGVAAIDVLDVGVASQATVKMRYVAMGQQMLRVDVDGTLPDAKTLQRINDLVLDVVSDYKSLVLSDYAGGVLQRPQEMIEAARQAGVPVYVDPKGTDWERYRGATLIKPNEAELRAVAGGGDLVDAARKLAQALDIEYALVTRGALGMTLVDRHCTHWDQPALSGPVVDVTGAGDTVLAVVAYLRASDPDRPWQAVLRLAAMGAGAVCARHGTSVVTQSDLGPPSFFDRFASICQPIPA